MLLAVILIAGGSLLSCGKSDEPAPTPTPTEENAPQITVLKQQVNVYCGVTVTINDNDLKMDGETVASWSDKNASKCKVSVTMDGTAVTS